MGKRPATARLCEDASVGFDTTPKTEVTLPYEIEAFAVVPVTFHPKVTELELAAEMKERVMLLKDKVAGVKVGVGDGVGEGVGEATGTLKVIDALVEERFA